MNLRNARYKRQGNASVKYVFALTSLTILSIVSTANALGGYYVPLMISIVIGWLVAHFSGLWKVYWLLAIFIGFSQVMMSPMGFVITSDFLVTAICLLILFVGLGDACLGRYKHWPSNSKYRANILLVFGVSYIVYLAVQFIVGYMSPVYPTDYSWKNSVKVYAVDILPFGVFLSLYWVKAYLPSCANLLAKMPMILLIIMFILIGLRIYEFMTGSYDPNADNTDPVNSRLVVPGINMFSNIYALRTISVYATILGACLWFYASGDRKLGSLMLCFGLVGVGLIGAALSGGRGTIILCTGGMFVVAWFYGRRMYLFFSVIGALLIVILINLAAPMIDDMPYYVRRAVALLRFDANAEKESIESSTEMRSYLYEEGMSEWQSDQRILLTGRGTLSFTNMDLTFYDRGNEYEKWNSALRTGRLHKTFANQLIRYGIIGCSLYLLFTFALIVYLYRSVHWCKIAKNDDALCVTIFALVVSLMGFSLMFLKDNALDTVIMIVVLIIVRTVSQREVKKAEITELSNEIRM